MIKVGERRERERVYLPANEKIQLLLVCYSSGSLNFLLSFSDYFSADFGRIMLIPYKTVYVTGTRTDCIQFCAPSGGCWENHKKGKQRHHNCSIVNLIQWQATRLSKRLNAGGLNVIMRHRCHQKENTCTCSLSLSLDSNMPSVSQCQFIKSKTFISSSLIAARVTALAIYGNKLLLLLPSSSSSSSSCMLKVLVAFRSFHFK